MNQIDFFDRCRRNDGNYESARARQSRISHELCVRETFYLFPSRAIRMGIRRFGTHANVVVRPTTATFSSYAHFVNMLFSRFSYPAHAIVPVWEREETFPKATVIGGNQLAICIT